MAASSTHDTKRSEDVRARINVLSEMPREWRTVINRWSRLNAGRKGNAEGARAPDRNDEYLLYQTLLGVWPNGDLNSQQLGDLRGRIAAYMLKATREGKVHTSWVNPSDDYDAAVKAFVFALLSDEPDNLFLADFRLFQSRIAYFGQFNALSQLLLKLVCPGVPDVYQGTELWDYSLVDPDNRRPVDFKLRRATLRDMQRRSSGPGADLAALAADLMESSADGRIKLYVLWRTLTYRRDHPDLFGHGAYTALRTDGSRREHALALARSIDDEQVIAVVPRLPVGLCGGAQQPPCGDVWRDTTLRLPRSRTPPVFRNLFTGEAISPSPDSPGRLPLAQALASFPVALLIRE
jgi:(1->4)-alpha-D-glucan 1-alpha-D-glucosylmutase